jgi:FAD/FMN-containing dehydrogenase
MTVFVVQQHQRRDTRSGAWRVVHDLTPARKHGQIEVLLSPTAIPFGDPTEIVEELHRKLREYNPDRDWLLPMGNPALIGWAVAIAAEYGGGRVRTLIWSARDQDYIPTDALLFPDCG